MGGFCFHILAADCMREIGVQILKNGKQIGEWKIERFAPHRTQAKKSNKNCQMIMKLKSYKLMEFFVPFLQNESVENV